MANWDWSQTDAGGLKGLDKLGNWNYLLYGPDGSASTDDRGHNLVNEITVRACTNRQAPVWDANGNLTQDGDTTHQPFGSGTVFNFVYDYRNRLVAVKDNSESPKLFVKFEYDGLNRRIRKIKYDADANETADTWFLWNGWQAIEERNHNSGDYVLRKYTYGVGGLDDHVSLINGSTQVYYLQDRLDNIVALVGSNASVVYDRYQYEPYGKFEVTYDDGSPRSSPLYSNPYAFTGQYYDSDAGLYYYKNRWYSPDLGRFATRDPAGYIDGMSLYLYAAGRPSLLGDSLGLSTPPLCLPCRKEGSSHSV